jgi:hypothetical protein
MKNIKVNIINQLTFYDIGHMESLEKDFFLDPWLYLPSLHLIVA